MNLQCSPCGLPPPAPDPWDEPLRVLRVVRAGGGGSRNRLAPRGGGRLAIVKNPRPHRGAPDHASTSEVDHWTRDVRAYAAAGPLWQLAPPIPGSGAVG